MDGRQPCHLAEPDGTSDLAREQACPGGLCHGHHVVKYSLLDIITSWIVLFYL